MNRNLILTISLMLIFYSCNNKKDSSSESIVNPQPTQDTIINLPCIEPFTHITSIGNVDIEYTQGDYKLQAHGNPHVIKSLETIFDSGILTVGMSNETSVELSTIKNKQNILLVISSPKLEYMAICGNGNFKSQRLIKAELFHCGNLGTGSITIDSLECDLFKFENNYIGTGTFHNVICDNAMISAFGTTQTNIKLHTQNMLSVFTGEKSVVSIKAKSDSIDVFSNNESRGIYEIECTELNVTAKNECNLKFTGKADQKSIKKDYGCIVNTF